MNAAARINGGGGSWVRLAYTGAGHKWTWHLVEGSAPVILGEPYEAACRRVMVQPYSAASVRRVPPHGERICMHCLKRYGGNHE